jgi:Zn-dependent protease
MYLSVDLGRVAGIPVTLHYSWVLAATLLVMSFAGHFSTSGPGGHTVLAWTAAAVTAVLFLASLLLHGLAHIIVARRVGLTVRSMTLVALGDVARIEDDATPWREFWVAIVGPASSLAIAGACFWSASSLGWTAASVAARTGAPAVVGSVAGWLGYLNLGIAGFNLMPAYPFDGGRLLRTLLWRAGVDREDATHRAARISTLIALLLIAIGAGALLTGSGPSGLWPIAIGWLLQSAVRRDLEGRLTQELDRIAVRELMTGECGIAEGHWSLQQFVEEVLLRSGHRCFLVRRGERVIGLITPNDVQRIDRGDWTATAVLAAARPLGTLCIIGPDTSASAALRLMTERDLHELPVVADGRVAGILTRANVLQLLETRLRLGAGLGGASR